MWTAPALPATTAARKEAAARTRMGRTFIDDSSQDKGRVTTSGRDGGTRLSHGSPHEGSPSRQGRRPGDRHRPPVESPLPRHFLPEDRGKIRTTASKTALARLLLSTGQTSVSI